MEDDEKILRVQGTRETYNKHKEKKKHRDGESSRAHRHHAHKQQDDHKEEKHRQLGVPSHVTHTSQHRDVEVNDSKKVEDGQKEEVNLPLGVHSHITHTHHHHHHHDNKNDDTHKRRESHDGRSKNHEKHNRDPDKSHRRHSDKAKDDQKSPKPHSSPKTDNGAQRHSTDGHAGHETVEKQEKRLSSSLKVEKAPKPDDKVKGQEQSQSFSISNSGITEIPSIRSQSIFAEETYKVKRDNSESDSSDSSEERGWSGPERYDKERDEEWLGIDREKVLQKERVHEHHIYLSSESKLELGCTEFMEAMNYFWWWLRLGGRMPFHMYAEDRIIKFKLIRCSKQFVYYVISSAFLTLCTTSMAFSLIRIIVLPSDRIVNLYQRVERLEVDKYWVYALVTIIYCTISSSVSLATIFDDGFILADFLTRWNLAISTVKYRPVRGLRVHFLINSWAFVIYAAVLIFLFNTKPEDPYHVPAVRGAAGLIGILMAVPFAPEVRFSPIFPHIETLGLFVHLYSAYSSKAILLMVTLYSKVLINMTRRWNVRLAYVLGSLGHVARTEKVVTVISFQKLFVEHTIIVGFLRHTGRIFSVGLGIFYSLKLMELIFLGYRTMTYIIFPLPEFNGTEVPGTPSYLERIRYTDSAGFLVGTVAVMTLLSALEWFITTYQITVCGDTILDGYSFIRRFGLILSKTSRRRRFVQSLNHAFSSASDYYVKATFTINREFIFNMFFWLASFCALLTAFHPLQLQRDTITVCSESGNCVVIQRTKIAWQSGGPAASKGAVGGMAMEQIKIIEIASLATLEARSTTEEFTTTTPIATTIVLTTTMPTIPTTIPTKPTIPTTIPTKPTIPTTIPAKPTTMPSLAMFSRPNPQECDGNWNTSTSNLTTWKLYFPIVCGASGNVIVPYNINGSCPSGGIDVPYNESGGLFDCTTKIPIPRGRRDSCGNLPLPVFDIVRGLAIQRPVLFRLGSRGGAVMSGRNDFITCCYDYVSVEPLQLRRCNHPNQRTIDRSCNVRYPPHLELPGHGRNCYAYNDLETPLQRCFTPRPTPPNRSCNGTFIDIFQCLCGENPVSDRPIKCPRM